MEHRLRLALLRRHVDSHVHTEALHCCDLRGHLHVQIMFVPPHQCFCKSNDQQLFLIARTQPHTCLNAAAPSKEELARDFFFFPSKQTGLGRARVHFAGEPDRPSVLSLGHQHVSRNVRRAVERRPVGGSHLNRYLDPPPRQPPSGTLASGSQNAPNARI